MRIPSRGGSRLSVKYTSGLYIVILVVVLLSYTFLPSKSLGEHYDHDVGASGHESTTSSERISNTSSLDTFSSPLNEAPSAPHSEWLHTANGLKDTSAPASDGATLIEAAAAAPNPQLPVIPRPQFDVVVAHHSEEPYYIKVWTDTLRSIPFVQELGMRMVIYAKGSTDIAAIKEASGADEVVQLPNVGREGGTYLHHLLNVYDDPPQFTLFAQAKLRKAQEEGSGEMSRWLQDRLRTRFGNETGFMSMDRRHLLLRPLHRHGARRLLPFVATDLLYAAGKGVPATGRACAVLQWPFHRVTESHPCSSPWDLPISPGTR